MTQAPLVAHVVYRFDVGGLENGVVNLINHMAPDRYRHAVVALTECAPEFASRVRRAGVQFHALHKPDGHGARIYRRFFMLMQELSPSLVHTRNLAALEMSVPAALAGVARRIHGEHGWDSSDPEGLSRKYRLLRRAYSPFVNHYVALSGHLADYLTDSVGIARRRVTRICNGVDATRFSPAERRLRLAGQPFGEEHDWVFGTVGRLQTVKDQVNLVRAFALLCQQHPQAAHACLLIAGDGPQRGEVEQAVRDSGVAGRIWLAGERGDVPEVMRALDCFVLPSRAEGISNTILEAMACGLPVIATRVGGNPELVVEGESGWLVPPQNPDALAGAMAQSLSAVQQSRHHGQAGRCRIETEFSLDAMVGRYADLYDRMLARDTRSARQ